MTFPIDNFFTLQGQTLLGIGPVSKNCVDAAIELAYQYDIPLFLIASRRQIEAQGLGGGYVQNWSTENFATYVQSRDKDGKIILCRDHGGPWQNEREVSDRLDSASAMKTAKESYAVDIESGFRCLHIDPSIDIWQKPNLEEVFSRTIELYDFCWSLAKKKGKDIFVEISVEPETEEIDSVSKIEDIIYRLKKLCFHNDLPLPKFIVVRTGTKVMEMRNIGPLKDWNKEDCEISKHLAVRELIEVCNRNQMYMKQHNTDYLPEDILRCYPVWGIHSANVAPEFGVAETKAFIRLLDRYELASLKERFLRLSYESKKWKKWMVTDTKANDEEKSIIAGHYVFSDPRFIEMKNELKKNVNGSIRDVDEHLTEEIKRSIMRYLKSFRLVKDVEYASSLR